MLDKVKHLWYNSIKIKERESKASRYKIMKYTIITINERKNEVVQSVEANTINEAVKTKRRANQIFVNCKTIIIDNEINKEVKTTNNYFGNTRVYRNNYIKMY